MAEQNTGKTEEPRNGNNSEDNKNAKLVRMLEKPQEMQLDNLTTKLTNETDQLTLKNGSINLRNYQRVRSEDGRGSARSKFVQKGQNLC